MTAPAAAALHTGQNDRLVYEPGGYVLIPKGITFALVPDAGDSDRSPVQLTSTNRPSIQLVPSQPRVLSARRVRAAGRRSLYSTRAGSAFWRASSRPRQYESSHSCSQLSCFAAAVERGTRGPTEFVMRARFACPLSASHATDQVAVMRPPAPAVRRHSISDKRLISYRLGIDDLPV
jgi:hypothetical protein